MRWIFAISLIAIICGACGSPEATQTTSEPSQAEPVSPPPSQDSRKKVLFFGNSLTAGYGVDLSQAFPSLIQGYMDSLDLDYQVINAGISGETTTGGLNRLSWALKQEIAVFVLELGANDGMRGIPAEATKQNLQGMIDLVLDTYPDCKILFTGMMVPPNMGDDYLQEFQQIFPNVAAANREKVSFLPFLLEGVAGEPELNQADGIHPTPEGHEIVAKHVWQALEPML
ncbi:MAG: arylesterase [Bacteroidota bacterium]